MNGKTGGKGKGKALDNDEQVFSYFDTGKKPSEEEPERFHAVEATTKSNREIGFGRYDVMLEPRKQKDPAVILEFKVQDIEEKELSDTVKEALRQIEEKDKIGERGIFT